MGKRLLTDAQIAILDAVSPLTGDDVARLRSLTDDDVDKLRHRLPPLFSGITQDAFGSTSRVRTVKFWLQSNTYVGDDGNRELVTDPALYGDNDTAVPDDITRPYADLAGVQRDIAMEPALQGVRAEVRYLCDHRVDPDTYAYWSLPADRRRFVTCRNMPIAMTGECYQTTISHIAPRRMHWQNTSPLVDYVQPMGDGAGGFSVFGKVKTAVGLGARNRFLQWPAALSGFREVMPPIPMFDAAGDGMALIPINYKGQMDNGLQNHASELGTIASADPAVHFFYDADDAWTPASDTFNGLLISGVGPCRQGDRPPSIDYNPSPRVTAENIGFPHSCVRSLSGSLLFISCSFGDHLEVYGDGEVSFRGSLVEGNVKYQAQGRHRAGDSTYQFSHEMGARLLEPPNIDTVPSGPTDLPWTIFDPRVPQLQYLCGLLLGWNGGARGKLSIGRANGGKPCTFRNLDGVYGGGINVYAGGRYHCDDFATTGIIVPTPATDQALVCEDGARARVNLSANAGFLQGQFFVTNADKPFRAGKGAAVTSAEFLSATKWNGQLIDRGAAAGDAGGPLTGGAYPRGDDSQICDRSSEPAGYGLTGI